MRSSLNLGKILGIPVGVHYSWFLILILVVWSLAVGYFPVEYRGWSPAVYWILGVITAILFFASVLIHELAHSIVARREGIPVRGITLFIFGGVSEITQDPGSAGVEFLIAVVGPLTSLALGGLFFVLGKVLAASPLAAAPSVYLARINVLLGLFNLIPGFPLDGGRVLRAAFQLLGASFANATRWATSIGRIVAVCFILFGAAQIFTGNFLNGLWTAFIGWFLNNAAESNQQRVVLEQRLSGVTARDVMTQDCTSVPPDMPVDELVNSQVLGMGRRCFTVVRDGNLEGMLTLHTLKEVPRERWPGLTVGQVMMPASRILRAWPDEPVVELLQKMGEADVNQVPVMSDGHLEGMITRERLLNYIRTRDELGV